jgi:hypothetical protein
MCRSLHAGVKHCGLLDVGESWGKSAINEIADRHPVTEKTHVQMAARPQRITTPLAESLPKSRQHYLGELTRRLEAELRGSPPLRRQSPPLRTEAGSSAQLGATNVSVEPRFHAPVEPPRTDDPERDPAPEAVPNDGAEKKPVR